MNEQDAHTPGEQPGTQQEEAQERERRLAALRTLAEQASQTGAAGSANAAPPARPAPSSRMRPPSRLRPRLLLILSGVLVAVLVIAGIAVYALSPRAGKPQVTTVPQVLTIDLNKDRLYCPSDMSWSPDGTRLAMEVMTGSCTSSGNSVSVLTIFDGRTGKLVQQIRPGALLAKAGMQGQTYGAVWSPDGKTLAVNVVIFPSTTSGKPSVGLLVIDANAGTGRLIQGPTYDPNVLIPPYTWDLVNGHGTVAPDLAQHLALTYRWLPDGELVPERPLMPDQLAAGLGPQPAGIISRWHSGTVEYLYATDKDGNPIPNAAPIAWYLASDIPTWSADARYFAEPLLTTRLVATGQPTGPITTGECANHQLFFYSPICAQVGVAPPDAGLVAALAAAQAGYPVMDQYGIVRGTGWASVSVDWRPDGKVLAALLPGDGFDNQNSTTSSTVKVTLLDTATGQTLGTLTTARPYTNGSATTEGVPYTAWSPNGQQLALVDYFSGRITVWGSASLTGLPK